MKLSDTLFVDEPLLRFFVKNDTGLIDTTDIFGKNDSLIWYPEGDPPVPTPHWRYVEIEPGFKFNGKHKQFSFALQWLGYPDSGEVKFARIAYQSKRNEDLYNGDNDDLYTTGAWGVGWKLIHSDIGDIAGQFAGGGNASGFMGPMNWEPWYYAYKTHRDVADAIPSIMDQYPHPYNHQLINNNVSH